MRVHDQYQAFFPPDVDYVADHAKRAVSSFPVARNFYYGVDYTKGVDITWYKNIPVPTSYMVLDSKYDFFGGYDHGKKAGLVHVANRHVSPGKKLWTWGNAEFGYAWDRELTDSDGPYVESDGGSFHATINLTFHGCNPTKRPNLYRALGIRFRSWSGEKRRISRLRNSISEALAPGLRSEFV